MAYLTGRAKAMRKNILILSHDYTSPFVDVVNQYTRLFNKEKFSVTVAYRFLKYS
jgi:hypothetical protein